MGVATGIVTLIAKLVYKSLSNCLLAIKQRCVICKSNCNWIAVHCASSPQFGCTHLIPSIDVCSKFSHKTAHLCTETLFGDPLLA
jgi:hypothetical protein